MEPTVARWSDADVEQELRARDWFQSKRSIDHGVQFLLRDGTRVNCFRTGRLTVQGKDTDLKQAADQLFDQDNHTPAQSSHLPSTASATAPTRVFIVYGHDMEARQQLEFLLLRLKLEPVVLQNVPGGGDTIIEKLEKLTMADFAVVLVTPDDEGRKRAGASANDQLQPRARQNVVLELGMVLARLGRSRVAILVKGNDQELERPSDIDGLLYIPFVDHVDEVKNKLASNLQKAGFTIRIEDLDS